MAHHATTPHDDSDFTTPGFDPAPACAAADARAADDPDDQMRRHRRAKAAPAPSAAPAPADPLADLTAAFRAAAGGEPLPTPTDLYAGHLGQRPVLARGLLPEIVERLAFDAAERMRSAPGPIALSALCAAAGAIRAGWRISGHCHNLRWIEPPVLWGAVSGGVSRKKTSLIRTATGGLRPVQDTWEPAHAAALHRWKLDEAHHAAGMAKFKAGKGPAPDPLPDAPGLPQIVVGDTSIEALGEIVRHNPAGVLQERDELTGWLAGMTAYTSGKATGGGSTARSAYLEAWNAAPYDVDRVGRGRIRIKSFGVSIVGGIQDDKVRACFDGDDDGLLARFLFAEAPAASDTSLDLPEDREAVEGWVATLDALANAATGQTVMLLEEAAVVREGVERRALAIEKSDAPATWKAHAGKWPGIFLRFCLIAHLIEHADMVRAEAPVPEVSGDLAGRVFRLMTEWLEPEAARVHFGLLNRTMDRKTGGDLETVADLILRRGVGRIAWGDVSRDVRALRATDPMAGAALLDTLAAHGWLSPRQSGKRARFWIVNPAVFAAFDARRRALKGLPPQPDATPAPAPVQGAHAPAPVPSPAPVPVQGASRDAWDAEFAPRMADNLADPCPADPEEDATRWAWLAGVSTGGLPC